MKLPTSGERFLPGEMPGDIELEHLHRYHFAADFVVGKSVLDLACGEGYGSYLLASNAASVIGMDVSAAAIQHACRKYVRDNLSFRVGACEQIPLDSASVDVVVSFETIEHHSNHESMLAEFRRVLRPDGLLVISSPDKFEYSDATGSVNEFHVKELYHEEFVTLVRQFFRDVRVAGQRVLHGSLIAQGEGGAAAQFQSFLLDHGQVIRHGGVARALYAVALASNAGALPRASDSVFERREQFSLTQRLVWANEAVGDCRAMSDVLRAELADAESKLRRCEDALDANRLAVEELRAERVLQRNVLDQWISGSSLLQAQLEDIRTRVDSGLRLTLDEVRQTASAISANCADRTLLHDAVTSAGGALARLQDLYFELKCELAKASANDALIQDLMESVRRTEADKEGVEQENSQLRERVNVASKEVADLKAQVVHIEEENRTLSLAIADKNAAIAQQFDEIQALRAVNASTERELASSASELEAVKRESACLVEQQREFREEISRISATLSASTLESKTREAELIAVSQSADERAEALQHRVDALQSSLAAEVHGSDLLRREVSAILNSRSWRLTEPMRKITGRLRQSKSGLKVGRVVLKMARAIKRAEPVQPEAVTRYDLPAESSIAAISPQRDSHFQATEDHSSPVATANPPHATAPSLEVSARRERVLAAVMRRSAAWAKAHGPLTHIFALPLLSSGGAEQTLAAICRVLRSAFREPCSQLVLVTDLDIDTTPVQLPASTLVIDITKELRGSSLEERRSLVFDCVRLLEPRIFHCINSEVGWQLIISQGETVRKNTSLVGSVFAFQYDWETGKRIGYAEAFLAAAFPKLDQLISDNQRFLNDSESVYGLAGFKEKARAVYNVPRNYCQSLVDATRERLNALARSEAHDTSDFRVLWAGRLDEEKRIDLLPEIARLSPTVQLHVFGRPVVGAETGFSCVPENMHLRGGFTSVDEIFTERFDAFIFTSRWEGLPNILLEVGLHGVPCIAASVGGVGELVTVDTGYPLPGRATAEDYVAAIKNVQQQPKEAVLRAAKLLDLIVSRHSPERFAQSMIEIPRYFK